MTSDGIKHNCDDLAAIMECLCERPSIQSKTPNKKPVKKEKESQKVIDFLQNNEFILLTGSDNQFRNCKSKFPRF
jgi:hypothetical protein